VKIADVRDYGAVADGQTLNTQAIQNSIDACHGKGGGRVLCEGGSFRTGTLILKSNVELTVVAGSRLLASEDLKDYQDLAAPGFTPGQGHEKSQNALILAHDAENIALTGRGEIYGSGLAFYDPASADKFGKLAKPSTPRPRLVMFYRCRNVLIEDLTFSESACWNIWLMKCENVHIHRLKIFSNRRMRNVDGIDIDACRQVTVSDCLMDTEDDCIAVRAMQDLYDSPAVCEDVTVSNCVFRTACNGIRVGCPGDGEIRNCVFGNLIISDSARGIILQNPKVYLPEGSTGSADIHDLLFSGITITARLSPVWLYVEEGIRLKRFSDITFSDIQVVKSGGPFVIEGSPETLIHNIALNNIQMKTSATESLVLRHCAGITLTNFSVRDGI